MFYGPECPFLYKGKQDLSFEGRFDVLVTNVDSRKICTKQPLRVQENAAFVIQRSALKDKEDWLVTDLGSFSNKGQSGKVLQVAMEDGTILSSRRWPRRKQDRYELDENEYLVVSTYWKHAKYQDFSRITTVVSQKGGQELDLALVQYQYDGEEHHISPKKHPRTKKPFIPTASSTRKAVKEKVTHPLGPSTIYDKVYEEAGGMIEMEAVSHAPRNIKQVKNARASLKRSISDEDEFYSFFALGNSLGGSCLKGLQWTPSPRVVYVEEWQMAEIVENCCKPDSTSVLSIDTTFNVGKFYVTSTTYQNQKFINERTGKYANLPGPALFHVCQDETQFLFFCNTLLEVDYEFEKVRFVGGDRDKGQKGFLKPLRGVLYLPCKKHIEDNMKAKMQSLQLDGSERNAILEEVFGRKIPPKRGLVDCNSTEEFETMMAQVSGKWNEKFTSYFKQYIADDIQGGMAPGIRREIGLKDDFFYNNAAECHNFRYKVKVKEDQAANAIAGFPPKSCTWVEAIQSYKRMVQECRNNIQRAFIGQGPFKLAPEWKSLEVSEVAWMTKTPEERRRHMAKADPYAKQSAASFTPASLACSTKCDEAVEDSNEDEVVIIGETSTNTASDTANFLCNLDDTGLPVHLNGSWNNARKILDLSGVGEFPGNDAKRAVISLTSGICHTVSCGGPLKKPTSCDDQCQGFISKGICAHMIAVASYNGCLESYLSSYRARISTIVKSSIPATTGKKENQKRQRKRKQNDLRDVSSSSVNVSEDQDSRADRRDDDLEIVFIRDTAACKCYGCTASVRSKPSEDPPPAPYDIFLRSLQQKRINKDVHIQKQRICVLPPA